MDLQSADKKAIYSLVSAHNFRFIKHHRDIDKVLIEALKHAKRAKINLITSAIFEYVSNFYINQEEYEKAALYNQKGLNLAIKEKRRFCEIRHIYNLGEIQLKINTYIKARNYFKTAQTKVGNLKAKYLER